MKRTMKVMLLSMITLFAISCNNDDGQANENREPEKVTVYTAGYEYNGAGKMVAKYWKDGIATNLTNGSQNAAANSIVVTGNDTYVAGFENNGTKDIATLWKNGAATVLPNDGSLGSHAYDIVVVGADVYVCGDWTDFSTAFEVHKACYWKNGILINLTISSFDAFATSIAVAGNDIYIGGYQKNAAGKNVAKYWKNGIEVMVSNGNHDATVKDIFINGTDIYIAGSEWNGTATVAKYWKNGFPVNLTNGTKNAWATAIKIIGEDIYVSGTEMDSKFQAKYWKNGIGINLTDGTRQAGTEDIEIFGTEVYAAGYEDQLTTGGYTKATCWINGQPNILNDGGYVALISSIFITTN